MPISMTTLTLLQMAGLFCAYLFVMVGIPAWVFGRKLVGHRLHERFMIYLMVGNFYCMNLVLLLQLMKLSHPATLILGTLIPAVWVRIVINKIPVRQLAEVYIRDLRRLAGGQLGLKSFCYKVGRALRRALMRVLRRIGWLLCHRTVDFLLTTLILAALCWFYGSNILSDFGYKASDVPVHNYWINAMNDNNIFVAGVYPHGFHCIIYYLHGVFGFDTYVLLRIFAFLETVMIHLVLLCFMRLCCKTRYAAYIGMLFYVVSDFCRINTYQRFDATLPQEYGMMFILPAIYFGFAFFKTRREELLLPEDSDQISQKLKGRRKFKGTFRNVTGRKSFLYLVGFAMSFAMTLMVHFYGTMVAGIFCVAMALGYCFWFFRKKYFWNVVITCGISVMVAVLPMAVAFIGGRPLEGSLRWGMSIITNSAKDAEAQNGKIPEIGDLDEEVVGSGEKENDLGAEGQEGEFAGEEAGTGSDLLSEGSVPEETEEAPEDAPEGEGQNGLLQRLRNGWSSIYFGLNTLVLKLPDMSMAYWVMYSFFGLILLGIVFLKLRPSYGAMLITTGLHHLFMCVMLAAYAFGLPALMDGNRTSIYLAYTLPLVVSFLVDAVVSLLFLPAKERVGTYGGNVISFLFVGALAVYLWLGNQVRATHRSPGQEMNEAITCLANIIRTEKDYTWTICSANDETQMGFDHGYHYEISSFLEGMEFLGDVNMVRIPTQVVYFFIEKVPLDYYVSYWGSGQEISEEGASRALPPNWGISMYQGEKRWICMSRMYYWAQEFGRLYPNEMQVYLETDQFVCYRVEQNMYKLFNFAIDYGYNVE